MRQQVVPTLHVPDLPGTIAFYESLGFEAVETYDDDGELAFAIMRYGNSLVMLNCGGTPAATARRDADLYVYADVEDLYLKLKGSVDMVVDLNDTFYGCREFTIRDNSGFWVTFGTMRQ